MDRRTNRVRSEAEGRPRGGFVGLCLLVSAFPGCAPFDVNVSTNEPLKVDLSMEVHVYQHGQPDAAEKEARLTYKEAMTNRRDRMKEIQELKNNRVVGEARSGDLEIRSLPAGEYGDYVRKTVEAENADRKLLIEHEAEEKGTAVLDVRSMQWRHWQRKSFPGEWIEVEGGKPGEFRWVQKKGASEEAGEGGEATNEEKKDPVEAENPKPPAP